MVSLSSAATVGLVGCVWATQHGWQPMPLRGIAYLAGSSLLLATGYQLLKYRGLFSGEDLLPFAIGFVTSFVFALVADA